MPNAPAQPSAQTALVTGASSFIGRQLCRQLHALGFVVHGFCREPDDDAKVCWHKGDIRDLGSLRGVMAAVAPKWVFHLAADTRRSRDPGLLDELFQTNVIGTCNIIEAARSVDPSAVVGVGSFEEYGDQTPPFHEELPLKPVSPYGITKMLASLLMAGAGRTLIPAAVLRFSVPYGPGQPPGSFIGDAINAFRTAQPFLMTRGEQTRDFLYVADAVDALLTVANNMGKCRGEILNACSGAAITLAEAAHLIGEVAGRPSFVQVGALPYRSRELMQYVGDPTKIANLLGWRARVSFSEGIRRTLAGG